MISLPSSRFVSTFSLSFLSTLFAILLAGSAFAAESTEKQPSIKIPPSGTQFVLIGDAWNKADELGHGFCSRNFLLGAYEWTVLDWKEKVLDRVACKVDVNNPDPSLRLADPHGLWNKKMERWITRTGTATKGYVYSIAHPGKDEYLPITNVNLFDTLRACNIMQRFKEYGDSLGLEEDESFDEVTERGGAYIITTDSKGKQEARQAVGYCFYIPTQDEWIKAAYYTPHYNPNNIGDTNAPGGYYLYPTRHTNPNPRDKESGLLDNKANYNAYPLDFFGPALQLSTVNYCGWLERQLDNTYSAQGTLTHYGCSDMGGNVNEWTTTKVEFNFGNRTEKKDNEWITSEEGGTQYYYPVRGGDYQSEYSYYLERTCEPELFDALTKNDRIGFRMAAVEGAVPSLDEHMIEKAHVSRAWDNMDTGLIEAIDVVTFIGLNIAGGAATEVLASVAGDVISDSIGCCWTTADSSLTPTARNFVPIKKVHFSEESYNPNNNNELSLHPPENSDLNSLTQEIDRKKAWEKIEEDFIEKSNKTLAQRDAERAARNARNTTTPSETADPMAAEQQEETFNNNNNNKNSEELKEHRKKRTSSKPSWDPPSSDEAAFTTPEKKPTNIPLHSDGWGSPLPLKED